MKTHRVGFWPVLFPVMMGSLWLLGACSKSTEQSAQETAPTTAVPLGPTVPAAGVSHTASNIAKHLEYGGELFAVVDSKGDIEQMGNIAADYVSFFAKDLSAITGGGPAATLDFRALLKKLGFYNLDGVGLSSWKDSDGLYHNLAFLYTPNGRTGLLKVFGGEPGPFITPQLAPADTDLSIEATLDLKSVEDLVVNYVQDIGGAAAAQQITDGLKQPIQGTTLTGQDIVDRLNTRFTFIVRADPKQLIDVSPTTKMPLLDFVIAIDGFGDLLDKLDPVLKGNPMFDVGEKNGCKTVTIDLPIPDPYTAYKPMLIADPKTKRLYLVSRESFANETVFGQGARLASSDDFKAATAGMATKGNMLSYMSKKGAGLWVQYYDQQMMASFPPAMRDNLIEYQGLQKIPHGVAATQTNLADGVLFQSEGPRSSKDIILAVPMMGIGILGGAAAVGIPAYKAMYGSSAMTVSGIGSPAPTGSPDEVAIRANLQKIEVAAVQYMLNNNVTEVRYQDLTSGPNPMVSGITPVAGEDYSNLIIRQTTTRISITTADGRVISVDM